jgi:hypothetical protein
MFTSEELAIIYNWACIADDEGLSGAYGTDKSTPFVPLEQEENLIRKIFSELKDRLSLEQRQFLRNSYLIVEEQEGDR